MLNSIEIMELQKLSGMEKFSKRTIAEELERQKLIELLSQVQYLGGLEEKVADNLIANGVTVQQWIPVSDRLPEANGVVLGYMLAGDFRTLKWKENTQRWEGLLLDYVKEYVTHWMPLPQPPEGE